MAILITGGAGFIGSHTCVEMLLEGFEVVVADDLSNSNKKALSRIREITGKDLGFYEGDVRDKAFLRRIFSENSIEAVIHFAGFKAVGESVSDPLRYYDNNLISTITLLEVMKEFSVCRLVFSSSATVYRSEETMPVTEEASLGASNPYGRTKLFIEEMLRDLCASEKEMSVALLRYFNPVGAHESGLIGEDPKGVPNNLMPFITQVAVGRREKLSVFGNDYETPDGTCQRDYIHVCDLARGHVLATRYVFEHKGCDTFNLGTGRPVSVLELVEAFKSSTGAKVPYEFAPRRAGDIPTLFASCQKAKDVLRFEAQLNIEDMCRSAYNWQTKNPLGYDTND